jgi:hypothetical protein
VAVLSELLASERAKLAERTPACGAMFRRAARSLAGGVTSSFQGGDPWPVYLARGEGARVWDVDDNEYLDLHRRSRGPRRADGTRHHVRCRLVGLARHGPVAGGVEPLEWLARLVVLVPDQMRKRPGLAGAGLGEPRFELRVALGPEDAARICQAVLISPRDRPGA